jgi:hypothetical protein
LALPSPSSTRSALGRRAFAEVKAALAASPRSLARLWPALSPLERAACWRLLPSAALPAAAAAMTKEMRWEAYLASSVDCAAPLLEDAPLGAREHFRAWTKREAALLRKGLA